jgi:hypothetical protein
MISMTGMKVSPLRLLNTNAREESTIPSLKIVTLAASYGFPKHVMVIWDEVEQFNIGKHHAAAIADYIANYTMIRPPLVVRCSKLSIFSPPKSITATVQSSTITTN